MVGDVIKGHGRRVDTKEERAQIKDLRCTETRVRELDLYPFPPRPSVLKAPNSACPTVYRSTEQRKLREGQVDWQVIARATFEKTPHRRAGQRRTLY